ncbi:similar to Saccharomyces cerevisiae YHR088W RPF1 Nucleolar protein involved in the assembly and export of the large ribosomal subunit [Maudiozyma saulgeensis]|uniref:Similar to Saccharomyces cerevisiae YHR088W RPF1 Nucleolar protein involved in the assembly and export of the large ribosomal subunit n=1 Tax=Maudiozyma saulgeensis TaxID=1789683 RepID=A0A1X7QWY1_9SACH|nr:similar to Saccharomyces cerevisiae YHR088W RPF1 Nucleolar protein involved in the assembly and export of the large ribosomal subunit [Kazachstania saulgeensis]
MSGKNDINISNKMKRQELFAEIKDQKNKERHTMRRQRAKEERENPELKEKRLKENVTKTIDNMRVYDETIANKDNNIEGEEIEVDDENDLMRFFNTSHRDHPPKIFLTTNVNAKKAAYEFANVLIEILPNVQFVKRKFGFKLKEIADMCNKRNFTDMVIINEDKKKVTGLTFMHLPEGPTFYFKISSYVEVLKIAGHGRPTSHIPELVLNNFQTKLGKTVGQLFQSIFPQNPDFEGRQVITLHNQRDYIFFRRHRYVFRDEEKVGLQELGPQFTMKLKRLQRGLREETEWEHTPDMDKDKKKFYL